MSSAGFHVCDGFQRIPVTMLSGFLGAGKTTLLKYVLENSTQKIACIVNDLASVNIDAKLVNNSASRGATGAGPATALADMVELQNGCACCSAADELFPAFAELITIGDQSGLPYERIILENSGVAEPQNIRDSFNDAMAMGHPVTMRIELAGMITVVDSVTFIADFGTKAPISMRPDLGDGEASFRPVVDLLVEQIECSDVIVLNKVDVLGEEKINSLMPIMTSLNPLAHVVQASFGKIPLELINRSGIASKMNIEAQHRSSVMAAAKQEKEHEHHNDHDAQEHDHHSHNEHEHGHEHSHHGHDHHGHDHDHPHRETAAEKFGITSFVYLRRKPFHPIRLRHMVLRWLPATTNTALEGEKPATGDSPIKRVVRSKGFAWLANSHMSAFYWSHAGQHFELRQEGDWWVTVDPAHYPPHPGQKQTIYSDFDEDGKFGDRRQELVFIGANMNKDHIIQQLDEALLTDEEMHQYSMNWNSIPDPLHPDMLHFKQLVKAAEAARSSGEAAK